MSLIVPRSHCTLILTDSRCKHLNVTQDRRRRHTELNADILLALWIHTQGGSHRSSIRVAEFSLLVTWSLILKPDLDDSLAESQLGGHLLGLARIRVRIALKEHLQLLLLQVGECGANRLFIALLSDFILNFGPVSARQLGGVIHWLHLWIITRIARFIAWRCQIRYAMEVDLWFVSGIWWRWVFLVIRGRASFRCLEIFDGSRLAHGCNIERTKARIVVLVGVLFVNDRSDCDLFHAERENRSLFKNEKK